MNISLVSEWQRVGLVVGIGLAVIGLGWLITSFLRSILPSKQSRTTDRTILRFQKRLFHGHYPLGRFRTPGVAAFIDANIAMVWVVVLLIVVVLLSTVLCPGARG